MKYLPIYITALILPITAQAEWEYGIEGRIQALYGYSNVKKHHHGVGRGYMDSYIAYKLDEETSFSLNMDIFGGIDREWQDYNQGRWGEEVYVVGDSAYGQLQLGQINNVASLFHNGSPSVGALKNNSDIVDFLHNPNWRRTSKETKFATLNSTELNTDGVAPKLSYISPEFYGTAIGFSYIPDSYNRQGLINKHAGYAHKDGFVGAVYSDGDWGWFKSKTSFGYAQYHGNDKEYSYALQFSRGNWTIGGGLRKTYIDGENKSVPDKTLSVEFDGYREGLAWNIGVGFEFGPFTSAVTYFDSKSDNSDSQNKIVAFSNQYSFNKYTDFYLAASHIDYTTADDNKSGYALITGIGINF